MDVRLELENLGKQLNGRLLFSQVSAVINEPAIIHILGTSGQGKSTLLRILGLLSPASEGMVRLNGKPASAWQPEQWRRTVSYVAQQAVMLPGTVEENLRTVSRITGDAFDLVYARQLLDRVGLGELDWSKPASQLSGGEKQRVALVRTLLLRPALLLLDEVTASLDIHSQAAVEQLLLELHRREGTSMIWVTHHLQQARTISQRIWFMAEQTLLEDRPTGDFFHAPETAAARQFLQSAHR